MFIYSNYKITFLQNKNIFHVVLIKKKKKTVINFQYYQMLFEEKDIKEWKDGIQKYYKEKKEKSVEPVRVNKITHKDIKQKETLYHPILQKYQQEEMVVYS